MSETRTLAQNIEAQGYAPVPIAISTADMQATMDSYLGYLELDSPYHEASRFEIGKRGDGDFGQFTRRAGSYNTRGAVQDNKDIFHFGSMTRQVIESRLSGSLPADMRQFLDNAESVYWAAERAKRTAVAELDICHAGLLDIMQPERAPLNDVLRLIAYYPNESGLARAHFDRSTATVAIGESHEGLRITPGQNARVREVNKQYMEQLTASLQPVEHREHEAKFFLGAGWNRLDPACRVGNEHLPLAWHDVVSSTQSVSDKVSRWAIVLFANPRVDYQAYTVPTPKETRPYKEHE